MPNTPTAHATTTQLADQAAEAIRALNHRTRPGTRELSYPADVAEIITTLTIMTNRMPQLLNQIADWYDTEHRHGRLGIDALAPLPDTGQTVHTLIGNLHHAAGRIHLASEHLDTAHQHAAHLATTEPAANNHHRGQNPCRSVGPNHLTKRSEQTPRILHHFHPHRAAGRRPGRETDTESQDIRRRSCRSPIKVRCCQSELSIGCMTAQVEQGSGPNPSR